jgi:hypothetical protein
MNDANRVWRRFSHEVLLMMRNKQMTFKKKKEEEAQKWPTN